MKPASELVVADRTKLGLEKLAEYIENCAADGRTAITVPFGWGPIFEAVKKSVGDLERLGYTVEYYDPSKFSFESPSYVIRWGKR